MRVLPAARRSCTRGQDAPMLKCSFPSRLRMPTRRPKILLADDHVVFTDGIIRILKDRFDVVGAVTDGSALVDAVEKLHPDVVISDISMPTVSGLEGLRQLKAKHGDVRVIFLTMHADAKL